MNPAAIAAIISLVEELVQQEPTIAAELTSLFNNKDAQPSDWQALRSKVLSETFESLAPDAPLPPGA